MGRRIIQIAAMSGRAPVPGGLSHGGADGYKPVTLALCDDGTLWYMIADDHSRWKQYDPIPAPEVTEPVGKDE